MKRLIVLVLLLLFATGAAARDDHVRPYAEGLTAVETGDWSSVVTKMQQAIAHEPAEQKSVRIRGAMVPYVPHFWLGVALAEQEKWDAAMRELSTSESDGIIQNTAHYSQLRATKSTIESRTASALSSVGLEDARELADAALRKALAAQAAATRAGAARLTEFRQANQKLQDALASRKDGTVAGYRAMAKSAAEASSLFEKASSKVDSQPGAVRSQPRQDPPAKARPPAASANTAPPEVLVSELEVVQEKRSAVAAAPPKPEPTSRDAVAVETPPEVVAEKPDDRAIPAPVEPEPVAPPQGRNGVEQSLDEIDRAYRAMVMGDLDGSSSLLTQILQRHPESLQALVLRGYARYLEGTLKRRDSLLSEAADDFRAALMIDPKIKLDSRDFSPKVIRFFESVRSGER